MKSEKFYRRITIFKIFSLLYSFRSLNIFILWISEIIVTHCLIKRKSNLESLLFDLGLNKLLISCNIAIISGYLINDFYDREKDIINTPNRYSLKQAVSQKTRLSLYFILNLASFSIALSISLWMGIYISLFIFGIWFYSHKLKRKFLISNINIAFLSITPLLLLLLFYKTLTSLQYYYGCYLFSILLCKEVIKNLENLKGDFIHKYNTIAVRISEKASKYTLIVLLIITTLYNEVFLKQLLEEIKQTSIYTSIYYRTVIITMWCTSLLLLYYNKNPQKQYYILHRIFRILLVLVIIGTILIKV